MGMVLGEQKRALRSVVGASGREHCRPIFAKLGVLTVPAEYAMRVMSDIHQYRKENLPRAGDTHGYETRNRDHIQPPGIRLHSAEFLRRGISWYNSCPTSWKKESTITFKKNLRETLLNQAPYNLQEITFS